MFKLLSNFPIFTSVVVFSLVLNIVYHHSCNRNNRSHEELLKMESKANSTRKKDLNNLHYITIDEKNLPQIDINDEIIISCYKNIIRLKDFKIVNFTGITNTELKLEYGVANLPLLTEYDTNFTVLCRELNKLGSRLHTLGYSNEAIRTFEYAVELGSDISNTYKELGNLYIDEGCNYKIKDLIARSQSLNSISKDSITKYLEGISSSVS